MEFNGDIWLLCKQLMEHVSKNKITDELVNLAVTQLKNCLDYVTEHDVKLSIEGLHHKFIIHAEYEKGHQFLKLVNRFCELSKPEGLTHPSWSILHLLFRLAYRPTEGPDYHPQGYILTNIHEAGSSRSENEDELSTTTQVKGPVVSNCTLWSQSEGSDECEEECETNCQVKIKPHIASVPVVNKNVLLLNNNVRKVYPSLVLSDLMQNNYWNNDVCGWTEYQILRELLWALQTRSECSSLSKDCSGNQRVLRKLISDCIHSSSLLSEYMLEIRPVLDGLQQLNSFIEDVVSSGTKPVYTLTQQAYASELNNTIILCYKHLLEMENVVAEQQVFTTLAHFRRHLKPWQLVIPSLAEIHGRMEFSPLEANHVRTAKLLAVLSSAAQEAQVTSYRYLYPSVLKLLSSSLMPMLNMLEHWFTRGEIIDPFKEFSIERNKAVLPGDERFWHDSLLLRSSHTTVDFLQPILEEILLAGRSVELLSSLTGHERPMLQTLADGKPSGSFTSVVAKSLTLQPFLNCDHTVLTSCNDSASYAEHTVAQCNDPLLEDTFDLLQSRLRRHGRESVCLNPDGLQQSSHSRKNSDFSQASSEFLPLWPVLGKNLMGLIRRQYAVVCKNLLDILHKEGQLKAHINSLRYILLMQAGDLMDIFCLQLFQKIDSCDEWNNESSLTLSLLNCISPRMRELPACISVTLNRSNDEEIPDLNHLHINYAVPWPINQIITRDSIVLYNNIFRFLLKSKRALTSLQRLTFKGISKMELESTIEVECLPVRVRQHRLHLLRAWLLHFVSSLQYYIMECVLESSHSRFDGILLRATCLEQIAQSHQDYIQSIHKQCLQQPSAAFLRDAIYEVFDISVAVADSWTNGIRTEQLLQLERCYAQHHHYVVSVLNTDAAHSMLPHVETLAAALTHSCPADIDGTCNFS